MEHLPARQPNIQDLLSQAVEKNLDVASMKELLAMAERLQLLYAEEQFNLALGRFQAKCPIIPKTKEVRDNNNQLVFKYTPVEDIWKIIQPILEETELTATIDSETDFEKETVTAFVTITHVLGFSLTKKDSLPFLEPNRMMKRHHCAEGALTIAKRLALCNALGIFTAEEDLNGEFDRRRTEFDNVPVTSAQLEELEALLAANPTIKLEAILRRFKVDKVEQLRCNDATRVINLLRERREK